MKEIRFQLYVVASGLGIEELGDKKVALEKKLAKEYGHVIKEIRMNSLNTFTVLLREGLEQDHSLKIVLGDLISEIEEKIRNTAEPPHKPLITTNQ